MKLIIVVLSLVFSPCAIAVLHVKTGQATEACATEDLKNRAQVQNKLAGVCEEMCKNCGTYPKCTCPNFVQPDATPGVMTWPELLEHMDNLSDYGADTLKALHKQASALQKDKNAVMKTTLGQATEACATEDLKNRAQVQNKLAGKCEDMCKNVGGYPHDCNCPNMVQPDSTPGVMTWPECLEYMDNLSAYGADTLKAWHKQASALQKDKNAVMKTTLGQATEACATEDLKNRARVQNKLAGRCEDMCKQVGMYPKCTCPNFVEPDSTPGVMTWPECLEYMDNLSAYGADTLKAWRKQASALQKGMHF